MIAEEKMTHISSLLDKGDFEQAFLALLEIREECVENAEKNSIMDIIGEIYCAPNIEALKSNYEKNLELLNNYPYIWGNKFPGFEELPITVYPIDNGLYYVSTKEANSTFCKYEPESAEKKQMVF